MASLYPRHIKGELDAALDDTPVVIVVGPRQAGKSTLASVVAEERGARYVTLDEDGPREAANEDPTGFVEGAALPFCIDEFQKAPALLPAIKARVDRARAGGRRPAAAACRSRDLTPWPWRASGCCSSWPAQRSVASARPTAAQSAGSLGWVC